jgi:hypothetical protein
MASSREENNMKTFTVCAGIVMLFAMTVGALHNRKHKEEISPEMLQARAEAQEAYSRILFDPTPVKDQSRSKLAP